MDLSIIIVSYNTKDILKDCLESVFRETRDMFFEVIVVDNNSTDGTVGMLKEQFPDVVVLANNANAGFSKANNQGAKIARGKYRVFLNSDTLVFDNSLTGAVRYLDEHPNVGVLGPQVLNADRTLQYSCWRAPSVLSAWVFLTKSVMVNLWDPVTAFHEMHGWDHRTARSVDCLSGCCLFFRRDVADKVGSLDEDFFMYYEDLEFCHRVRTRTDYDVVYYPGAKIIHLGQMSADHMNFSFVRACYESVQMYFRKCHGPFRAMVLKALCWTTWQVEIVPLVLLSFMKKARTKLKMLLILSGYVKN